MENMKQTGSVKSFHSSQVKSSTFSIGFEKLDRGLFDPEKAYDRAAELGVKWARIQSGWARTEKVKGVYDFEWLDSIVDNLLRRGIQPWMCLCYGNGLYDESAAKVFGAAGCPPVKTPEQKEAWFNYTAAVGEHFRSRISYYEVWNEPDGAGCWKHGVNGVEYGEFIINTARGIRKSDPDAKIIANSCQHRSDWLMDVISTGAFEEMDAYSYHNYAPDELDSVYWFRGLRTLCQTRKKDLKFIQGETGTQSRPGGAGSLEGMPWTPLRQAKFLSRRLLTHMFEGVMINSYFSCVDMCEALNGVVSDKKSYQDFGYFGVLSAVFDENGIATGEYTPKPSFRALQVLAAIFKEEFTMCDLPIRKIPESTSPFLRRQEDSWKELITKGFTKPNGSSAFVYWKPCELISTSYEASTTFEVAGVSGTPRLIDLLTGNVYEIPENLIERRKHGILVFRNIPLRDFPLLLTFGDFAETIPV